ncbi:MAG: ATP-binding protein [Chloroflexota bacterium]|nr:ATP-binding protein [Chloroflexota bacterium]
MRDSSEIGTDISHEVDLLIAGLEAMDTPVVLLGADGRVLNMSRPALPLLGMDPIWMIGRPWADVWAPISGDGRLLTADPRRILLESSEPGARPVPVHVWQRPLGETGFTIVGLQDLSGEEAREREVIRIFQDLQEQADDLFALYQISQFLSNEQDLNRLCSHFLRELEHIVASDAACLYLVTPQGNLQPEVWQGLAEVPSIQPDAESARAWLRMEADEETESRAEPVRQVLALPLMAEERLIGLALLRHSGELGRRERFLQTAAKEMGTALRAMQGRRELLIQEQKLEAIVDSTTDAIIQVGPDLQVRHFNPAAEQITGYLAGYALAHSCGEVLGCEAGAEGIGCKGACPFAQVLLTREPVLHAEIEVESGGTRRYLAASVAHLAHDLTPSNLNDQAGGEVEAAAVGILRDMSKQKQIEQLKDDFLITVSHQLRTPVALLRGYVDTLQHLELSPHEQRNYIKGIATTASRLESLVGQILDVTRIGEGRLDLHREPVRVVDVLREAMSAIPHTGYRSRIWTELEPNLPTMYADPERLKEVVINLLDNSLKYSPPTGQVVIRASASMGDDGRSEVMLQVMDEGIGISPEDHATLFQKFHRGSNSDRLQVQGAAPGHSSGAGLGLFICRSIIEAHGGRISLLSTPGSGTVATFWVPAAIEGG